MKRDMEIVRRLLLAAERNDQHVEGSDKVAIAFHVKQMERAGLIYAAYQSDSHCLMGITWAGWDLLDAIRDQSVWNKAKATLMQEGASWTIDLLKAWVTDYLSRQLGIGGRSGSN